MFSKKNKIVFSLVFAALMLMGCSLSALFTPSNDVQGLESTIAAETVEARLTQIANDTGGDTTLPTNTPLPTSTSLPTSTPLPTNTPEPTSTPKPTATAVPTSTPVPCNAATFIKDMTVADGAQFAPGSEFIKVWRFQNVGSCTWTTDYDITFDGGDKMGGSTVSMPKKVKPGELVDIPLPLQAPNTKGTYKGFWMLRDDDGDEFGIGFAANKPFWVEIKVVTTPDYQYNFAANFCDATWKTDSSTMYCHGTAPGYTNYVQFTKDLTWEGGKVDDEAALVINVGKDNRVRGIYPAYTVQAGDHFMSRIGCVEDSRECKVKVVLNYRIKGTDNTIPLGEWIEKHDGNVTLIDVDLDAAGLAGKEVIFVLDISSRSTLDTNRMFWFVPSIQN